MAKKLSKKGLEKSKTFQKKAKKAKPKASRKKSRAKAKPKAASVKCVKCGAPFNGLLSRIMGLKRSEKNLNVCNKCAK